METEKKKEKIKNKIDIIIYLIIIIGYLVYSLFIKTEENEKRFIIKYKQDIEPKILIIYDKLENKEYIYYKGNGNE